LSDSVIKILIARNKINILNLLRNVPGWQALLNFKKYISKLFVTTIKKELKSFSNLSLLFYRIITYPYPYRVGLYRLLLAKFPLFRPHYLACMFDCAKQASELGYTKVSVIEFGVARGNGLVAIEKYTNLVFRKTGFRFIIYGFDMGNNQRGSTKFNGSERSSLFMEAQGL